MKNIPIVVKVVLEAEVEPQYVEGLSKKLRQAVQEFKEVKIATITQSEIKLL